MASREDESNKKVVVVRNDDYPFPFAQNSLQKPNKKLHDGKPTIAQGKGNLISRVTNTAIYPQTSTDSSSSLSTPQICRPEIAIKGSVKLVPNKKNKKKVPVLEHGLEKSRSVDFTNFSKPHDDINTEKTLPKKDFPVIEHEASSIDDDLEEVIRLVNKKYGDALEAELSFLQLNKAAVSTFTPPAPLYIETNPAIQQKIVQGCTCTSETPSDINLCKWKEEQIANEQPTEEDINKAKEHLETILILDSPDSGYKLLSREELKQLPEKIFASPCIKEEVSSIKQEDLSSIADTNLGNQQQNAGFELQNVTNKNKSDTNTLLAASSESLLMTVAFDSNSVNDSGNKTKKKPNEKKIGDRNINPDDMQRKRILESDLEDFDSILTETAYNQLSAQRQKKVIISEEDAVILDEIDKFMADVGKQNKILAYGNRNDKPFENKEALSSRPDILPKNQYQNRKRMERMNIISDNLHSISISDSVRKSGKDNDKTKPITLKNANHEKSQRKTNKTKVSSENKSVNALKSKKHGLDKSEAKRDILEKLVLESGIQSSPVKILENPINNELPQVSLLKDKSSRIKTMTKSDKIVKSTSQEISTSGILDLSWKNTSEVESIPKLSSDNVNANLSSSSNFTTISQGNFEEHESCEYSVMIINKDGFLEPLSLDTPPPNLEPYNTNNENQFLSSSIKEKSETFPQSFLTEDSVNAVTDEIHKEEILTILQKAKAVQYKPDDKTEDNNEKERLRLFNSSLKERVKVLIEMYQKLETITDSVEEELKRDLKTEDKSILYNNLNFIKSIVDKTFSKEDEKKPKYRVVKITKKSTDRPETNPVENEPPTKKIPKKTKPRVTSHKLMHKTLYRMNRLLNVIEQNRMLMRKKKRENAFVSKLRETARIDLANGRPYEQMGAFLNKIRGDTTEANQEVVTARENDGPNAAVSEEAFEKFCNKLDINEKSLTVVLERPGGDIENINGTDNRKEVEGGELSSFSSSACSPSNEENNEFVRKIKSWGKSTPNVASKTKSFKGRTSYENKENTPVSQRMLETATQKRPSGYYLRPRKTMDSRSSLDGSKRCCKVEKGVAYEVNYSNVIPLSKKGDRTFRYVLRNDNRPCVVLYNKQPGMEKTIFEKVVTRPADSLREDEASGSSTRNSVTKRYETRSVTESKKVADGQRVLRSRKI